MRKLLSCERFNQDPGEPCHMTNTSPQWPLVERSTLKSRVTSTFQIRGFSVFTFMSPVTAHCNSHEPIISYAVCILWFTILGLKFSYQQSASLFVLCIISMQSHLCFWVAVAQELKHFYIWKYIYFKYNLESCILFSGLNSSHVCPIDGWFKANDNIYSNTVPKM